MAAEDILGDEMPYIDPPKVDRRALLHQQTVWINREAQTVRVADMSPGYVTNLRKWLAARAVRFHLAECAWAMVIASGDHGDMAQDALDREYEGLLREDPHVWMRNTTLFMHLTLLEDEFYDTRV